MILPSRLSGVVAILVACVVVACGSKPGSGSNETPTSISFDRHTFILKDFLIQPGADPGWFMSVSITQASTPNPLADFGWGAGLFAGAQATGPNFVRFVVTQNALRLIDMKDAPDAGPLDSWPAKNVESQGVPWVDVTFSKTDSSDLNPFGATASPVLLNCVDSSDAVAQLIPGSLITDASSGYMEFGVSLTLPILRTNADCLWAFGPAAAELSGANGATVTLSLLFSFVRPDSFPDNRLDGTYVPMPVAITDPIQHKYGAFQLVPSFPGTPWGSYLLMRHDPNRPIVYYFDPSVPPATQVFFTQSNGVQDQINSVLAEAGAKARVQFLNFNDATTYGDGLGPPRHFGDVRYSFIVNSPDTSSGLLGAAQFQADPRTGQVLSSSLNVFGSSLQTAVSERLDMVLTTLEASFGDVTGSCTAGQTIPLVTDVAARLNTLSTVYPMLPAFLGPPASASGPVGPANFVPARSPDFYRAYYALLPWQVHADPNASPFVGSANTASDASVVQTSENIDQLTQFDQFAAQFDDGSLGNALAVVPPIPQEITRELTSNFSSLSTAVTQRQQLMTNNPLSNQADDLGLISFVDVFQNNGRQCVNSAWETQEQYTARLTASLAGVVALHELGHTLGLRHNFMGSVDQWNFPYDAAGEMTLRSSSVMENHLVPSDGFFLPSEGPVGFAPYDSAALAWIYGNNLSVAAVGPVATSVTAAGLSGQVSSTAPWNDPLGFESNGAERSYLYCSDEHVKFTPLCRRDDLGSTPSEIVANEIQQHEWDYTWANFRLSQNFPPTGNYDEESVAQFADLQRFITLWNDDWTQDALTSLLDHVGVTGSTVEGEFAQEISAANQLATAYQHAIIDQSAAQRPFASQYDSSGNMLVQGIQIDKIAAFNSFTRLWPSNYDPGLRSTELSSTWAPDPAYTSVARALLLDVLTANFASFQYAQFWPIANFDEETRSPSWPASDPTTLWLTPQLFATEEDFLSYCTSIAVEYGLGGCTTETCTWDPCHHSDQFNRFTVPGGPTYVWSLLFRAPGAFRWAIANDVANAAIYALILNANMSIITGTPSQADEVLSFALGGD